MDNVLPSQAPARLLGFFMIVAWFFLLLFVKGKSRGQDR